MAKKASTPKGNVLFNQAALDRMNESLGIPKTKSKRKKRSTTITHCEAFEDCFATVNASGVTPRQWPYEGESKSCDELTSEEQADALAYRRPIQAYQSCAKLETASIFDPLLIAMEDIYSDFPAREQEHAESNSEIIGINTTKGEKHYLNWVISGLLSLMQEAIEAGHSKDATRFAFEAGILWSMAGQVDVRRIAIAQKLGSQKANQVRSEGTDLLRRQAVKRYRFLMSQPGAKREATLKRMARGAGGTKPKAVADMTRKPNADGVMENVSKWPCLRTLRGWTKGL